LRAEQLGRKGSFLPFLPSCYSPSSRRTRAAPTPTRSWSSTATRATGPRDIAVEHGARVTEIASHEYERRWGTSKVVVWMLWAVYLWSFVRNLI